MERNDPGENSRIRGGERRSENRGFGASVQMDKALIRRLKYNRGRVIPRTWVVGLIDDTDALRLAVTPNRSALGLERIILKHGRLVVRCTTTSGKATVDSKDWGTRTRNWLGVFSTC